MRLEIPDTFKYYDPFDLEHSEGILKHFKVEVDCRAERDGSRNWGYLWKYGGVTLAPESKLSEQQARAIVALAVYLYAVGVHPGLDDRLASAYILQGWSRIHAVAS